MIDDEEYSTFKFNGDEEPESEQTLYQDEAKDRRVEKLSHRVTIISIFIPVLIGVVFYIAYRDITSRVNQSQDTGSMEIQNLSTQLQDKFDEISSKYGELEASLTQKLADLEKVDKAMKANLKKAEDTVSKINATKADKKDQQDAIAKIDTALSPIRKEVKDLSTMRNDLKTITAELQSLDTDLQQKLITISANITSDGRPILGLDSRDLLELILDANEKCFFVPAHIWTPWFSVLGSKSGFNSIAECFDDLAGHIYAVETGLSTDPPMNWMCSFLDNYTLTANSDAHSPERLGRNCNRFDTELSYDAIMGAIKAGDGKNFLGTIDLFPQEGKYHFDGHRKCNIVFDPLQTLKHNGICPECSSKQAWGLYFELKDYIKDQLRDHPGCRFRHIILTVPVSNLVNDVKKASKNTPVCNIANIMIKNDVSHIPIVNADDRLVGMVSDIDLMGCIF